MAFALDNKSLIVENSPDVLDEDRLLYSGSDYSCITNMDSDKERTTERVGCDTTEPNSEVQHHEYVFHFTLMLPLNAGRTKTKLASFDCSVKSCLSMPMFL